jgi:hypothetical protein
VPVVIRAEYVDEAVGELLRARIHPHFVGYLCMLRTAVRDGATRNLRPDFKEFFETFLRVPNGTADLPYLRPFWHQESEVKAWANSNVAGTYATSSVRPGAPFLEVVDVSGSRNSSRYSLKDRHLGLALAHLAFGKTVPVVPLATFLYRDYAFENEDGPSMREVVQVFRDEFGYTGPDGQPTADFQLLYDDDSDVGSTTELFEERT